jgi:hypothetical protein
MGAGAVRSVTSARAGHRVDEPRLKMDADDGRVL